MRASLEKLAVDVYGQAAPLLSTPAILDAIRTVFDPEIPVNIWELGLIYDIAVDSAGVAAVQMTLTSPGCPVAQSLPVEVARRLACGAEIIPVVLNSDGFTDLLSPLHDVLGHDGDPRSSAIAPTERPEVRLYTAAVLRQIPEEPLQPVPMGEVFLASDEDVTLALRMDTYTRPETRTAIPIGLYRAGGMDSPIYLDADFLVGPEAAHLNIAGVSGLVGCHRFQLRLEIRQPELTRLCSPPAVVLCILLLVTEVPFDRGVC